MEVISYSCTMSYTYVDFQYLFEAEKREVIWEGLSSWEEDRYLCLSLKTREQNHGEMGSRPWLSQQRASV